MVTSNRIIGQSRKRELAHDPPNKLGIVLRGVFSCIALLLDAIADVVLKAAYFDVGNEDRGLKPQPTQPSTINVEVKSGGPAVLTTSTAEFQVRPDGYVQAFLLKDGQKLSLDEPSVGAPADSDFVRVGGKDVHFTLDFQQAQVHEAIGKMGVGQADRDSCASAGPLGNELAARAGARSL